MIQRTLPETIQVEFQFDDSRYLVEADLTRIQQIMLNLAVNARDAMPDGGKLTISLTRVPPGEQVTCITCGSVIMGDWVKLSVRDSGTGIPQDILPYIFDPFYTTKEPGKGSGLGLAQVYGIVKQHNGHVSVTTTDGHGTEFKVFLPAYSDVSFKEKENRVDIPIGSGQTVLIVEDELAVRKALVLGLDELAYNALEATNGYEALEILEKQHEEIDLVLSDVVMPEMGGIQLARALRRLYPQIGVILLTGYPREQDSTELESSGVHAILGKPINLDELARAISEAI